jgi:hypothetical protein
MANIYTHILLPVCFNKYLLLYRSLWLFLFNLIFVSLHFKFAQFMFMKFGKCLVNDHLSYVFNFHWNVQLFFVVSVCLFFVFCCFFFVGKYPLSGLNRFFQPSCWNLSLFKLCFMTFIKLYLSTITTVYFSLIFCLISLLFVVLCISELCAAYEYVVKLAINYVLLAEQHNF